VEELTRALDYSNNAREIMRAEKEHGWREAQKWEAKYDALAEERATTGRAAGDLAIAFVRMADERGRPMGERAILITAASALRAALASPGEGE